MTLIEINDNARVHRVNNDINGNPRYVISWLDLGLDKYESTKLTRSLGLSIYRGKDFGGGFVFQSYNVKSDVEFMIEKIRGNK